MKKSNVFFKTAFLLTTAVLIGCSSDEVAQNEKQNGSNGNSLAKTVTFTGENILPTRISATKAQSQDPTTRTWITHTVGNGAKAFWSTGDKIWVKDVYGKFQKSNSGEFTDNMKNGIFFVSGSFKDGCTVHYTGTNGTSGNIVTIAANQTQSKANDFTHAGVSGDCGTAEASARGNNFKFRLTHKASYICFLPHTLNAFIKRSKLFKIEVTSEDEIAGDYDFSTDELSDRPKKNGSKKITLNITAPGGFTVTNPKAKIEENGSYIVIAPGTHKLTIRYWFRNDKDNPLKQPPFKEPIEGTITKTLTITCEAGKIYDVTANLDPKDYTSNYYMWDAKKHYWEGQEQDQPKENGRRGNLYPAGIGDRWYNEVAFPESASRSCQNCPNANECLWYIQRGDPHWDEEELWTAMGHLYTGGMWFKKKTTIGWQFNRDKAPNHHNYTQEATSAYYDKTDVPFGRPEHSEDYFFLPALGDYDTGYLNGVGEVGNYWTSTPTPQNGQPGVKTKGAYYLYFYSRANSGARLGNASLYGGNNRYKGLPLWTVK